jgi:hypothetical protein
MRHSEPKVNSTCAHLPLAPDAPFTANVEKPMQQCLDTFIAYITLQA